MRIIAAKTEKEVGLKAAELIAAQVTTKPDSVLGLATGSSPLTTYAQLAAWYESGDLDFSRVTSVNLDEYVGLPGTHEQSYRYFMNTNLFSKINIDPARTNVPSGTAKDLQAECRRYDRLIEDLGGIDLQLLGIGPNGHIGFNEPDDRFHKGTHIVTLTERTRQANARFFSSIDEVPTHAITMGIKPIMNAKQVVLIAIGKGKAQALCDMIQGPITPACPASILQLHRHCTVVADEEALSLLKRCSGAA